MDKLIKRERDRKWCKDNPIRCKAKKAVTSSVNWVDEHKAEIAGFVAGAAVGIGCAALIGVTGVGAVACGALAGAVGNMVTYAIQTEVEGKGNFSLGDMLIQGGIGAVVGGVMGGLGSVGFAAARAGVAGAFGGAGAKAAVQAGASAARKEVGAIVSGKITGGMFAKGGAQAAEGAASGSGCGRSFAPGTKVLMADGSHRPIKDVKPGDEVTATDPRTGETIKQKIVAVHINHDLALTDLTVRTPGAGIAVVHTSQNHPFWDVSRQIWVNAGDLDNTELRSIDGSVDVMKVDNFIGAEDMYDLTIATTHTYYVIVGETPVLVHNWQRAGHHGQGLEARRRLSSVGWCGC